MASPAIATIPTPPPMSYDIDLEEREQQSTDQNRRLWEWLKKLRRDRQASPSNESQKPTTPPHTPQRPGTVRKFSKKVGIGLPRSTTFKRQQDEQRNNLEPTWLSTGERRQNALGNARALSSSPNPLKKRPKKESSAPDLTYRAARFPSIDARIQTIDFSGPDTGDHGPTPVIAPLPAQPPPPSDEDRSSNASYETSGTLDEEIRLELEKKWILNLSMHFRDKSPREKFFITYAQKPEKWRRVTVSCDYRNAEEDSLEADLQAMDSQREKNARIYESLRDSLSDIQFYETVTNLKLETQDERLHVHVTEDRNEIIAYPPCRAISHLHHVKKYRESELHFVEHMSGFVYKVTVGDNTWIKKEIPGPDSVDEFLYEVNALSSLVDASHVIELKGLVTDNEQSYVKGLLIAYAEKNALVDIIYDNRDKLPWARRERWARQIVKGLSEIHEAGFVQGDFTLSNLVIDENDEAQIIDINRRGCPLGWEPPEIGKLIQSGQRISMFIGIKSDIFQLGMALWGLAMQEDEPERQPRPLSLDNSPDEIPGYFRGLVARCLDSDPVMRPSAKDLLKEFPASVLVPDPSEEPLPEIKPAHMFPAVPIVKASPHRAEGSSPKSHRSQGKVESNAKADPASKRDSVGRQNDNSLMSANIPHHNADSEERAIARNARESSAFLNTQRSREDGDSVEPQPSSQGNNGSASSLPRSDSRLPHFPLTPPNQTSPPPSPSSRSRSQPQSQAQGEETVPLDTEPSDDRSASPSWEAITGAAASPYEIPLSCLTTNTEPADHRRRIYHPDKYPGMLKGPSPPPHVDSGLADVDDATPRTSNDDAAVLPNPKAVRAELSKQPSGSPDTTRRERKRRASESRRKASLFQRQESEIANDTAFGQSGQRRSADAEDEGKIKPMRHTDSGFVDSSPIIPNDQQAQHHLLGGVGGNDRLSFKERVKGRDLKSPVNRSSRHLEELTGVKETGDDFAALLGKKEEGKARGIR